MYQSKDIQIHSFKPVFNKESKILILGSFPSIASESFGFYYGNSNNRFWNVLGSIFNKDLPTSKDKKLTNKEIMRIQIDFLLHNNIAIWDCIKTCKRKASNSSDKNLEILDFNDIVWLISQSNIKAIFCNGKLARETFDKLCSNYITTNNNSLNLSIFTLPSTSSANARYKFNDLVNKWSIISNYCKIY